MEQQTTEDPKAEASPPPSKKRRAATRQGVRYIGTGLVDGRWTVFVIEPDGEQRELYRSTQDGEPGRPFAFSRAVQHLEQDAARELDE